MLSIFPQMTEGRLCQVHLLDGRNLELLVQVHEYNVFHRQIMHVSVLVWVRWFAYLPIYRSLLLLLSLVSVMFCFSACAHSHTLT